MMDIRVRAHAGAYVVSLSGVADAALLGMLLETVRQLAVEDGPVVVDLSDVTLIAPDAIRSMLETLSSVRDLRIVSTRDTAREILRRCGLNRESLCKTVDEAVAVVGRAAASDDRT
jgi:anti-anti-sigma regulatory factor